MAKITEELLSVPSSNEDDDLAPDDYVFIIGANGKMKSVIFPAEETFEYHPDLLKIFSAIGIDNPDALLESHIIH
jgi:hypothetical protein